MEKEAANQLPSNKLIERLKTLFKAKNQLQPRLSKDEDALYSACRLVAEASGITLSEQQRYTVGRITLETIARQSQFRTRRVLLRGRWWQQDNGPLLGFCKDTSEPVALLPRKTGGYQLVNPKDLKPQTVNAAQAATLSDYCVCFYRTFPDQPLTWKNLMRFALQHLGSDIKLTLVMQIFVIILGFLIPVITGILLGQVVPNANTTLLKQFIVALIINSIVMASFSAAQMIAIIRIELKSNVALQSAVWDRLLRLPIHFFRKYSAGDLAFRASAFDKIQQAITGTFFVSMISGAFSLIILLFIFYYDVILALGIIALCIVLVIVNGFATWAQLFYQRRFFHTRGKLMALLLQIINSISKLRIAHREEAAFNQWSKKFSQQIKWFWHSNLVIVRLNVFQETFAVLALLTFFAIVVARGDALSFGVFITINAAFAQFFAAILSMSNTFANLIQIIPLYERAKPILKHVPEQEQHKFNPGQLKGAIELINVSFRYPSSSFKILKQISFKITPGDFIALVGPSGSGKTTLIRLLLGFEQPESGSILYDGFDLATLNIHAVRRQLGVILQEGVISFGSIYENVAGAQLLSREHVKELLSIVEFDQDLKSMPMGLDTILLEAGRTLSMGQRQRLLLAHALASSPSILLLDESMTALDNLTQAKIFQNLSMLHLTKVVVAQRLSTVRMADCIYVIDKGEIVESGSYQQLIKSAGLFAQLEKHQH